MTCILAHLVSPSVLMQRLKQLAHDQGRTVIATVHQVRHNKARCVTICPFKIVIGKLCHTLCQTFLKCRGVPVSCRNLIDSDMAILTTRLLLKPRASLYEIFDDLMVMSKGRLVYGGDAQAAFDVFAANGIPCPPRVSVEAKTRGDCNVSNLQT